MNKKLWLHLMMAILVAGLFMTISCAKKQVVSESAMVEDQSMTDADAKAKAEADAKAEAERIKAQELQEQMEKEQAMKEAKIAAAKARFLNQNIHFEYDSSALTSMAKMILKEKAAWLEANPSVSVTIQGHCDDRGTTEYNLALGERRASAVKNFLSDLGVPKSRLNTVSYGEERPLDPAQTEEAWRKNRRAQFVLK
ncbi:peptidoglycan-associated lipoprotein Pal [Desulfospira joergensenii]|uniref:peptidoglycan-associated lipoprotein Pal n=1 Tax=Desulfospira joergensenii TaxID=53329 RepID=UPI0003B69C74|nr:peptidoglycan-associated lipoprotein Pal [Desulfospira joergensenii]